MSRKGNNSYHFTRSSVLQVIYDDGKGDTSHKDEIKANLKDFSTSEF